jgi:glucose/arabinose dehydrogenase
MTRKVFYTLLVLLFVIVVFLRLNLPTSPTSNAVSLLGQDAEAKQQKHLNLDRIQLPEGFKIEVYASVPGARQMAFGERTLFVGSRGTDKVYAVRDLDGDHKADEVRVIASGLYMPNGVAFRDGSLYVAEVHQILRFDRIEDSLDSVPKPVVLDYKYSRNGHHGWKYIRFGPDGYLYVPVGAPCNVCEKPGPLFASITKIDPRGGDRQIFAEGVRNSVGFDWHPVTGELWFTDNGRDWLGDDLPPDELNHAPRKDMHFGFPYCHGGFFSDPKFGKDRPCHEFTAPAMRLGAHVASLGMRFYTGKMFPEEYQNQIFIAEHGSWNRSSPIGYRLTLVKLKNGEAATYESFATGWITDEGVWGRPVDVLVMGDGSLLVSDDHSGTIYRISYETTRQDKAG